MKKIAIHTKTKVEYIKVLLIFEEKGWKWISGDKTLDWVQPIFNNRKGHPILFNKKIGDIIINEPVKSNLKKISNISVFNKKYWKCNFPQILDDIDTNENYYELIKTEYRD